MQVQLRDLIGRNSGAVLYIDRNVQAFPFMNPLMIYAQVRKLELRIAQPISKRKERCALFIPVTSALLLWFMRDVMRVKNRHLPDVARPVVWQLSSRNRLAIKQIRDCSTSLCAGIPRIQNCRDVD